MKSDEGKRSRLGCVLAILWRGFLALLVVGSAGWAALALYYSNLPWSWLRAGAALAFPVLVALAFLLVRPRRWALLMYAGAFAAILVWYYMIPASNHRDWQPDLAQVSTIDIKGDQVVVHNVRNCHYRSETD